MSDEQQPGEDAPGQDTRSPRSVNLAAVAGGIVLIGLVAFALYRKERPVAPPITVPPAGAAAAAEPNAPAVLEGTAIGVPIPMHLTPEAAIIAERYRCVCGCNLPLNACTCSNTPGSRDMKALVQQLVDEKKTGAEIDAAMVARFGEKALMSHPAPSPSPGDHRR
jgi:Cytochrome C biogenesis protein